MPVDGPRNQRFDGDTPKTLHGITKLDMFIAQAVDTQGYRKVVLVGKIPNDKGPSKFVTFPEDFWDKMGAPPKWLEEQIRETVTPDEVIPVERETVRRSLSPKKRTDQLKQDDVNVMGV